MTIDQMQPAAESALLRKLKETWGKGDPVVPFKNVHFMQPFLFDQDRFEQYHTVFNNSRRLREVQTILLDCRDTRALDAGNPRCPYIRLDYSMRIIVGHTERRPDGSNSRGDMSRFVLLATQLFTNVNALLGMTELGGEKVQIEPLGTYGVQQTGFEPLTGAYSQFVDKKVSLTWAQNCN